MWQFMAPTARDLGVEVSSLVDDRRDPFVSTAAAADYLVELHERYDSWFLALAAYNAGPDRIDGLLRRWLPDVEPSDAVYWALRDVLPRETRDFVPNFIGAVVVASAPEAYGYATPPRADFDFETVPVRGSVSFSTIARATGRHTDEIARLNPELLRGVTPPDREIELRLPPGSAGAFRAYFSELADRDR
jgi:membrane-bound lytic murein transglycosylase D